MTWLTFYPGVIPPEFQGGFTKRKGPLTSISLKPAHQKSTQHPLIWTTIDEKQTTNRNLHRFYQPARDTGAVGAVLTTH